MEKAKVDILGHDTESFFYQKCDSRGVILENQTLSIYEFICCEMASILSAAFSQSLYIDCEFLLKVIYVYVCQKEKLINDLFVTVFVKKMVQTQEIARAFGAVCTPDFYLYKKVFRDLIWALMQVYEGGQTTNSILIYKRRGGVPLNLRIMGNSMIRGPETTSLLLEG